MPDMQSQPLDEALVRVYRTAPADLAALDAEAIKGRVKVAVPQLDGEGNPIAISETRAEKATVIRAEVSKSSSFNFSEIGSETGSGVSKKSSILFFTAATSCGCTF